MDNNILKTAIELTEKAVNFRCKIYPDTISCEGCADEPTCGAKQITWNCDGTLKLFENALNKLEVIDIKPYIEYVQDHGGYCDCEVIFNVKDCSDFKKRLIDIKRKQQKEQLK
jgi:hypothetical protein